MKYVALDLETTALDILTAYPLEVAAVTFDPAPPTDPEHPSVEFDLVTAYVPYHAATVLHGAEPKALQVNRYYERGLFDSMCDPATSAAHADALLEQITGATIVGANPAYDTAVLYRYLVTVGAWNPADGTPWHFRLYDVSLATRVALGLDYTPGLAKCRELWALPAADGAHTALVDAISAMDVFRAVEHRFAEADR